jgi:hypothetical protein
MPELHEYKNDLGIRSNVMMIQAPSSLNLLKPLEKYTTAIVLLEASTPHEKCMNRISTFHSKEQAKQEI